LKKSGLEEKVGHDTKPRQSLSIADRTAVGLFEVPKVFVKLLRKKPNRVYITGPQVPSAGADEQL
jgi:hypothetical protein